MVLLGHIIGGLTYLDKQLEVVALSSTPPTLPWYVSSGCWSVSPPLTQTLWYPRTFESRDIDEHIAFPSNIWLHRDFTRASIFEEAAACIASNFLPSKTPLTCRAYSATRDALLASFGVQSAKSRMSSHQRGTSIRSSKKSKPTSGLSSLLAGRVDLKSLTKSKHAKSTSNAIGGRKRGLLADDALRPNARAAASAHAAPSETRKSADVALEQHKQRRHDAHSSPAATTQRGPSASASSSATSEYKLFHVVADDGGVAVQDGGASTSWHSALWHGCADLAHWRRLNTINEGSYGVVYRAQHATSGEVVAIKEVKMSVSANDGFPVTALRELNALLSLRHENLVRAHVMAVPSLPSGRAAEATSWAPGANEQALPGTAGRRSSDSVFMVMEYLPHDLRALMNAMTQPFPLAEVKTLMQQLLLATAHMHKHGWMHRDLKTANLLLDNAGRLVVCDLGLARQFTDPPRKYTAEVVSLWYRAPEVLLGNARYGPALDIWSCGCIFGEMLTKEYLLQGTGESNQLKRIFELVGSPTADTWPGFETLPGAAAIPQSLMKFEASEARLRRGLGLQEHAFAGPYLPAAGLDLLRQLLALDPAQRITAEAALQHPFWEENPRPRARHLMMRSAPETNKQRHGSKALRVERNTLMYGHEDD